MYRWYHHEVRMGRGLNRLHPLLSQLGAKRSTATYELGLYRQASAPRRALRMLAES